MEKLTDLELLENLILRNPELDRLENLLSEFNIFETLDLRHAEIRHSNVLAWLLNPHENHGLASYFTRQFLKFIASANRSYFSLSELSLIDFELFTYSNIEIRREWNNIDIVMILVEEDKKLVVGIENKIKTVEHGDQLQRYRKIIEREFEDYIHLYIYLTPENLIPSDEEWIPFNYDIIANLLDDLLEHRKSSLSQDIFSFIFQYKTILRRYIVGNSEVQRIAIEIYKKHKEALDLIFQHKPDIYLELSEYIQSRLKGYDDLIIDTAGKTVIRFTSERLDSIVEHTGEGWTKSKRILLFEFSLYDIRVVLRLYIGPGDNEYRKKLQDLFLKNKKLFKLVDRKFGTKWHAVYQKEYLRKRDFEDDDSEKMKEKIEKKLVEFMESDLPSIHEHFETYWNK